MLPENDGELSWESQEIGPGQSQYGVLPPGIYPFVVKKYDRARFSGSEKMSACPMALLHLEIQGKEGKSLCTHRLFLHKKVEGILNSFFKSIGARQSGETVMMDWRTVPGATGYCRTSVREYDGKEYTDIKEFIDPARVAKLQAKQNAQGGDF